MSVLGLKLFTEEVTKFLKENGEVFTINQVQKAIIDCASKFTIEEIKNEQNETLQFLDFFLQAKEVEGRSKGTINRYKYIISRVLDFVKTNEQNITIFHLRNYFAEQKNKGISDRTLEGERSVLSSYFGWLFREKLITDNPCNNLNAIKHIKKVRKPFTLVEIEKMKEACHSLRNKTLVNFLLSTGCRVNEVCTLNISNVNIANKECTVLGKGNKERVVYINEITAMLLERYLAERTDNSQALFVGKQDRLTPGGIRALLKRIERVSGVENVHPHRFRRTLATTLINHGMAIQEVATILGHDKIDTTMQYVYIESANVKNSYNRIQ